jgi:hypothetical protein
MSNDQTCCSDVESAGCECIVGQEALIKNCIGVARWQLNGYVYYNLLRKRPHET